MTACLEDNTVVAFVQGELDAAGRDAVEAHVDACASCRELLSQVVISGGVAVDPDLVVGRGTRIADRFVVEREAGSGGMAVVYRALDLATGTPVALKLLHRSEASQEDRFEREAALLAEVHHPAIVHYLHHGRTDRGVRFLAMDWLEGSTLARRLRRSRLSIEESLAVTLHTAEALAAIHERGIVHRDIKPTNLFLVDGVASKVKVLDFGLARPTTSALTAPGSLIGTLGYMAPEQIEGGLTLDGRTDIFALGCVLYECLTGAPAFVGPDSSSVLRALLLQHPPPARERCPGIPLSVELLLDAMLQKHPGARPAEAGAVVAALAVATAASSAAK